MALSTSGCAEFVEAGSPGRGRRNVEARKRSVGTKDSFAVEDKLAADSTVSDTLAREIAPRRDGRQERHFPVVVFFQAQHLRQRLPSRHGRIELEQFRQVRSHGHHPKLLVD